MARSNLNFETVIETGLFVYLMMSCNYIIFYDFVDCDVISLLREFVKRSFLKTWNFILINQFNESGGINMMKSVTNDVILRSMC